MNVNKFELSYVGRPGPDFVISEGCGILKQNESLSSPRIRRQARGRRVRRIVGGNEALRGSLPWQVIWAI